VAISGCRNVDDFDRQLVLFCPLDFSLETTVLWFVIMIPLPNPEQFCAIHAAEL